MKIKLSSVPIDDYDRALNFYTEVMGFQLKRDMPLGDGARWITVVSPEEPDGVELLLEPNSGYPAMKALKESLVRDGIPVYSLPGKRYSSGIRTHEGSWRAVHDGADQYGHDDGSHPGRYLWEPDPDLSDDGLIKKISEFFENSEICFHVY